MDLVRYTYTVKINQRIKFPPVFGISNTFNKTFYCVGGRTNSGERFGKYALSCCQKLFSQRNVSNKSRRVLKGEGK